MMDNWWGVVCLFGVAFYAATIIVHVILIEIHLREIKAALRSFKFKATSGCGFQVHVIQTSVAGTETSVHVLRKADEAKVDKPGWPAWRDVKVEKPPRDWLLWWNADHGTTIAYDHRGKYTHWMPLPEGPKV